MSPQQLNQSVHKWVHRMLSALVLSLIVLISSLGLQMGQPAIAMAAPLTSHPQMMALFGSNRAKQVDKIAKEDADKTFGAGTSNKAEGAVKQAKGKAKRDIQNTQSALKDAQGKAKQDTGRTQNTIGDVQSKVESAAEGAQDAVKGLLNQ